MGRGSKKDVRLIDALASHRGKTVLIGVRSSFFFIGPSEEAIAEMRLLSLMARHCINLSTNRTLSSDALAKKADDIGARVVVKTYVRNPDDGSDEIVILIEGSEFGAFWTRAEYLSCRHLLLQAIGYAQQPG